MNHIAGYGNNIVANDHAVAGNHHASAVSWAAIIAGAVGAAALSLILLVLGTGLGLAAVSPWVHEGISGTSFGVSSILWITFTQLAAAGLGGYLAGRLRTRWMNTHVDEVYFRDTTHGFLAWALATLLTAGLLTSVIGSVIGGGVQAAAVAGGAAATAGAATMAANSNDRDKNDAGQKIHATMNYFVDTLLRDTRVPAAPADGSVSESSISLPPEGSTRTNTEILGVFLHAAGAARLPDKDVQYLGALLAQRNNISQAEAETTVTDTYARMRNELAQAEASAKAAADKARKASAYAALWLFISLLSSAFFASWLATYGGRQRDL